MSTVQSTILNGITDSLFALDAAGSFIFVSPKTAEILGQTVSALVGRKFSEALAVESSSEFSLHVLRAFSERAPIRFEHFCTRLNRWFEHQVYINEEGGISVYGRDVTAGRRLEEALRASEERFRRLVDSDIVGVSVVRSHCVTEANKTFLQMVDRCSDDVVRNRLSCSELTPPEYHELDRLAVQQMAETGYCSPYEKELVRKDGSRVAVIVAATRIDSGAADAEPNSWECLNLVVDLSEQKRSEKRLRNIVEASKVLALSLDHDKTLKDLARFLASSVGEWCVIMLREGDAVYRAAIATRDDGKHASLHAAEKRLWSVSQLPCLRSVFQKGSSELVEIATSSDPWLGNLFPEAELRRTLLKEFPHSAIAVPLPSRGKISGTLLLGSNSSQRFTAEDLHLVEEVGRRAGSAFENARLYQETQEANRLKDEFVSIVSHELRTPLTPILGAVYMLRSEPNDRKIFARALDLIERNANAQARLVEDLLDMSRVISGKMRLTLEPVDIQSTIHAAVEALRSASDAKGIEIRLQMEPLKGMVLGDETRLQQVMWNLLANSVKFTPASGRVSIDLRDIGGHAEIQVVDDGIGIEPAFLPFVFDGFRQQDGSRTRVHGGLGLGLAIVRHVVELHGGTVQAHSLGDRHGCTFVVKLPLRSMSAAHSVSA